MTTEAELELEPCGCCEVNDFDEAPWVDGWEDSEAPVPGSCLNCGHSPGGT